jgi:hypothetical protein
VLIQPVPIHSQSKSDSQESPCPFGHNRILTAVKRPDAFCVKWEIGAARLRMIASYLQADEQEVAQGLRVYDATNLRINGKPPHPIREICVQADTRETVVDRLRPGGTYLVDFGLFHDRRFCPVLRSEPVTMPARNQMFWQRLHAGGSR